ncbi:MAG: TonB-dependent receptor plug domain-containing protein [Spirochaetales bacterium]|nr:TonB-dependent receptor plug domain-containing protein [Spirochaetales bacterium]
MKKLSFITLLFCFMGTGLWCIDLSVRVMDRDLDIALEGVLISEVNTGASVYTDPEGKAILKLDNNLERAIIIAELIGYEDRKLMVRDFTRELVIEMLMQGVLEGEELVVEEEAIGETDEEIGVSTVVEEEIIESVSKIGIIEDAMSIVKILPGVTYTGSFGSFLSVRGGDPSGLTVMLDGFVVKYPYHWGGICSIFNPNIVESIKFSPGIFSAKYGQATSGIMEVTTVTPDEGVRLDAVSSTSTIDIFLQLPLGENETAGIFSGFRLTNYDLVFSILHLTADTFHDETLLDMLRVISRVPYIYDFYFKTFYRPTERVEWYMNGFYGNDGVGSTIDNSGVDTSETIVTDFDFHYTNTDVFVTTGLKILPSDLLFIHVLAGYEFWIAGIDAEMKEHGTRFYSDEFIDEYGYLIPPGEESFTVGTVSEFEMADIKHGIQGRVDFDLTLHKDYLLQWGAGCYVDIVNNEFNGMMWGIIWEDESPVYRKMKYETDAQDSCTLDSFLYLNLHANLIPDVLGMDFGTRLDHSYFMGEDDFTLNTYPVFCPRLNLTFSPDMKNDFFKKNSFSIGAGIFTKNPFTASDFSQDEHLEDFDIRMPKTLMTVLGWETEMPGGFRFKIEGYYKYMFDLYYSNYTIDPETGEFDFIIHNDGFGHAAGFDLLLNRKISRFVDGMISYTFVYARYKYPETDGLDMDASQRGIWFYPFYHRFHSLNFLLNVKPSNSMTITAKMSFATGTPKREYSEKEMFPAIIENDDSTTTVAEMYSRESFYSDSLRSNFSLPLDIKVAFHDYWSNSKVRWECYFAVEDILSPLWAEILPGDNIDHSKWSGEEQAAPSSSFSIPIPSIGLRLSY